MEKKAADALASQLNTIDVVHQEILNWWKQDEKFLVWKMMSGRVINMPGDVNASVADLSLTSASPSSNVTSIDHLLTRHSELLKDFQLLKSRLQYAKRNLQRLKRKYLVEFNNWKKGKVPFDDLFEQLGGFGDAKTFGNYSDGFVAKNDLIKNNIDQNNNYDQEEIFDVKQSNSSRSNWDSKELRSDYSLLLNESDLSSVLSNSAFSTSTLLSDSRVTVTKELRRCSREPRLVRSVPTTLHSATTTLGLGLRGSNSASLPLTGDQDIDEEIIAFYQDKQLN